MGDRPLEGKVAVVTGGSRGAGRGIAVELGAAGATVYVTGRSTRGELGAGYDRVLAHAKMETFAGSFEETAEEVTRAGGTGVAVRCDHTSADEVAALFARVERERGRLDLLVNNAWGGHRIPIEYRPFWEDTIDHWEGMFNAGVRNHLLASMHAAPIMIRQESGLIVTTTFWDRGRYTGSLFYDLAKNSMSRLAFAMARDLRPHGVASVAVSPGWMRTEIILAAYDTDEERWRDVPALATTESPRYVGRAVAALAADSDVMRRTGESLRVGDLAREYGFTDVDGRQVPPFELPE